MTKEEFVKELTEKSQGNFSVQNSNRIVNNEEYIEILIKFIFSK